MEEMLILISYDIKDNRKRNRAAKILLNYGIRIQYSVFECDVTPEQLDNLKKELYSILDREQDQVRSYEICKACKKTAIISGVAELLEEHDFRII
jgi:CRISPR-associated protein Cas2